MNAYVIGAGWSGLAAAASLCRQEVPVTLYESSQYLGGRARSLDDDSWRVDNGQHIMFGAYHYTLNMLNWFGIHERTVFERKLLCLELRTREHESICMQVPNLAAPMHLLWGVMRTQGLDIHERGTVLRLGTTLIRKKFDIRQDQPLEKWLLQQGQTRRLIKLIWQPFCLALLNTPINKASTRGFLQLAKKLFAKDRDSSDLLFIKTSLSQCLPVFARRFIENNGGVIKTQQRITGLVIEDHTLKGFMIGEEYINADRLILATPAWITQKLLAEHEATHAISAQLGRLVHYPLCTIYLQYPEKVRLNNELIGLVDCTGHWIFDRALNGQPGLMAVIICGPGEHMTLDDETLANQVMDELALLFPHWPRADAWRVIREKRATFGCTVDCEAARPTALTPVKGLFLAGDYLNTGYPARLEGAVKSGVLSARAMLGMID